MAKQISRIERAGGNAAGLSAAAPVKSTLAYRRAGRSAERIDPIELDRLVHEQTRLGILSALAVNESLSFNDLKKILKTTDGNLSVHARKLEAADYIACSKFFQGRKPKTEFRLTRPGRGALGRYLDQMEQLIRAARVR
ncbi:MAG TPA: transcriptional regulator [Terriglobia bacterium]|nr:transcriptional regulator [Terriglobia bacterium]